MGPPTGGQDSDLENEDSKILNTKGLPEEITGEVEIFNIRNNEIEKITSDGEDRMWNHHQHINKNKMLKNC